MKSSRRIQPWAFAFPTFLLLGLASCVAESDGGLVIQQAQPLTVDGTSCVADTDETVYLPRGVVDMAVARNYELFPLIRNNFIDVVAAKGYTAKDTRLNTKNVSLLRAKVSYHTQDDFSVTLQNRTVPLSASVGTGGGKTTVSVELLTPAMIDKFRNSKEFVVIGSQGEVRPARSSVDLSVDVTVEGQTQDGNDVESNTFTFALRVCNGCLVYYPPQSSSDAGTAPNCLAPEPTSDSINLCGIGWQGSVDCGTCLAFAPDPLARQLCQPAL